jgi:hypothetical protein
MNESDVYIVAYSNGSCGSFMLSMVERLVQQNLVRIPLKGNKYNNCHQDIITSNHKIVPARVGFMDGGQVVNTSKECYESFVIRTPGKPVFVPIHFYSPREMLNRFPNAKSIVILHDRDDIPEIAINSFFKFILGEHAHSSDIAAKRNFNWLRNNAMYIFDSMDINTPEDIPDDLLPMCVEIRTATVIASGFHFIKVRPEFENCVYPIRYKDIVGNPEKVLQQLSEFTGKPMTDFVREQYYGYVERQKKFIADARKILKYDE